MDVIISSFPADLEFEPEILATVQTAASKAGALYGLKNAEVSITLTNNEHIHELNLRYRGIDRPTDVLSFALNEGEEPEIFDGPAVDVLGDIIISVERTVEQAAEYGHSVQREIAFLTVHGMLHLLGYDHMEEADRIEMRREEEFVMKKLEIARD
ncbi:MAG: rRNA maturation RNase YbeY [Selenomonadaceae bacterium]|jgi:metalloprotein, YbeY/UPF0054 family